MVGLPTSYIRVIEKFSAAITNVAAEVHIMYFLESDEQQSSDGADVFGSWDAAADSRFGISDMVGLLSAIKRLPCTAS